MAAGMRTDSEVHRLVDENRSLVEWSVNRFLNRHTVSSAERDDLVSWGLLGLLAAARAFDPDRGLKFSTLATVAIERSILRGAMQADKQRSQVLSLDEALTDGDGDTRWLEMIPDEDANREIDRTEAMASIGRAMNRLRPDQRRLIQAHFFQGHSLADLARHWGTSRQAMAGQLRRTLKSLRRTMEPV